MITWLQYSKTGNFYQRTRRLTKVAVLDCFKAIRASATQPSRNLIHHVREKSHGAVWSAIAFFYDRDPASSWICLQTTTENESADSSS